MVKDSRKLFLRVTPWILLLALPLLYVDLLWVDIIHFDTWRQYMNLSSSGIILSNREHVANKILLEKAEDSLDSLLLRLVKGEGSRKLEATGFGCNRNADSIHCVTNRPVKIDTRTMTVMVPSTQPVEETVIRPYARQEDAVLLESVTPVKIFHGNDTPSLDCEYTHNIPAVIFSSSGFVGNVFHEMNEIIMPLFITTT